MQIIHLLLKLLVIRQLNEESESKQLSYLPNDISMANQIIKTEIK